MRISSRHDYEAWTDKPNRTNKNLWFSCDDYIKLAKPPTNISFSGLGSIHIYIMSMFRLFSFTLNLSLRYRSEKKESVPLMQKMAKACHFESVFPQLVHHRPWHMESPYYGSDMLMRCRALDRSHTHFMTIAISDIAFTHRNRTRDEFVTFCANATDKHVATISVVSISVNLYCLCQ